MSSLREIEAASLRAFVQRAADEGYLSGRVLDYGCGKQPYRDIVEAAGGEYVGYDSAEFPANVGGPNPHALPSRPGLKAQPEKPMAVLCTQVIQYVPNEFIGESENDTSHYASGPAIFLEQLHDLLYWHNVKWRTGHEGHLVLTYPTNWPEVEPEDLHRFTKAGMERLLTEAGFEIVLHEVRHLARLTDESFPRRNLLSTEWLAMGYGCVARA